MKSPLVFLALVLTLAAPAASIAQTRIVTWNIANLHERLGEPLRSGAAVREQQDIDRLRKMERAIGGHVYALQEINGPAAARLVFPQDRFELCVSSRYQDDLARGLAAAGPDGRRGTDRIYTVLAIRRGHFDSVRCEPVDDLGVMHYETGEPARETRRGVAVRLKRRGQALTVLSLHMKSACHHFALAPVDGENPRPDCATFERMAIALEAWVDHESASGTALVLAGDFNRRINRHFGGGPQERRDHFFTDLDDGDPPAARLTAVPAKAGPEPPPRPCFAHQRGRAGHYHDEPIDFIMANSAAAARLDAGSVREHDYRDTLGADFDARRYAGRAGGLLSDHCPVSADFRF